MATTYLEIDYKESKFYHFSKTAKEGYNEIKEGVHKKFYFKGVYGLLQSVRLVETKLGKKISISLKNSEGYISLQVPMYTSKGDVDNRFAEPLICILPNLEKGKAYRFFPWTWEPEDQPGKVIRGIAVNHADLDKEEAGDKVERFYIRPKKDEKITDRHLPALTYIQRGDKNVPSAASIQERQFRLEDILAEQCERLKSDYNANRNSSSSTPNSAASNDVQASTAQDMPPTGSGVADDDLPF